MNHSKKLFKTFASKPCSCTGRLTEVRIRRSFSVSPHLSKKKDLEEQEKLPVYDFGKFHPEKKRLYVFGRASHGALGLIKLLIPRKEHQKQMYFMQRPVRHAFGEHHDVKDIAAGHGFTLIVIKPEKASQHVIFGCGNNTRSQLGFQPDQRDNPLNCLIAPVPLPIPVDKTSNVLAIAAGRGHSLISVEGKGLLALGDNSYGQCGRKIIEDEEYEGSKYVTRIPRFGTSYEYDVTQIASRFDLNVCLTRMGTVYTFGSNESGQLGRGKSIVKTWVPGQVEGDLKGVFVKKVVTSGASSLAVSEKGELFGWGSNDCGQIDPSTSSNIYYEPIHIKLPRKVGKVIDVAIGNMFAFALSEYGNVYVWGTGRTLGLGPNTSVVKSPTLMPPPLFGRNEFSPDIAVVKIAASSDFAAAVNSKGDLFTWGNNEAGCLGLGKLRCGRQFFPFKVALAVPVHKMALGEDHTLLMTKGSY